VVLYRLCTENEVRYLGEILNITEIIASNVSSDEQRTKYKVAGAQPFQLPRELAP